MSEEDDKRKAFKTAVKEAVKELMDEEKPKGRTETGTKKAEENEKPKSSLWDLFS